MPLTRKKIYLALAILAWGFAVCFLIPSNTNLLLSFLQNQKTTEIKNKTRPLDQASQPLQKPNIHPAETELLISIPQGAKLPAAFMDEGNPEDSEGVKELLLSLEGEFQEEYETELRNGHTHEEAWENARSKSDQRYQALFGQEAYLEALNLAAEEAATDWEKNQ